MPSLLQLAGSWLRAPANEFAFLVRSTLRWQRGAPALANEDKQGLFRHLAADPAAAGLAAAAAQQLVERFALQALAQRSTRVTFAGSLQHLAGLERLAAMAPATPRGADGVVRVVDVGCGDFHYASALAAWFARRGPTPPRGVVLRGLEYDGHGVYRDGHSRADHAFAHARLAGEAVPGSDVRFEVADFRAVALPTQDVVTMFFPFLTAHACLRWGAPVSRLRPRRLLERAVATLAPAGWLLVVNQTGREAERVAALLRSAPVERIAAASWASPLVPWHGRTADQVGTLWRRLP